MSELLTAELRERVLVLETQYSFADKLQDVALQTERTASDAESEKGTRVRVHAHLESKMDALDSRVRAAERLIAIGIGISLAGQVFLAFWLSK
jgi:hypothetical protein